MSRPRPASLQTTRAILVIVLVLLLGTLAAQLRITRCTDQCSSGPEATACCAGGADDARCCGCCRPGSRQHAAPDAPTAPGQPAQRATCRPGCLTTLAFGGIELAPAPAGVHAPAAPLAAVPMPPTALADPAREPLARGRPFDRGPPRPDRDTALLATTVLLL